MKNFIHHCLALIICLGIQPSLYAQNPVKVSETHRTLPTYNFSDPNPVPEIGRIYPYFRFDGYSAQTEDKKWKFIEIENDYIKIFITPEIGGKIWGAIEKSTGKEFIYFNHSVKFRDVAMRGPWTSGGIESNFGIIGHAPTCSTPVDYLIQENEDGSVSCFIGAIDLPSRTEWRVEINLQPDKSYFTTKALWHNPTALSQAYYQWMNAGVKAAGNLEFTYPGSNYIGHDGSVHSWPIHPEGRDISWYENNNFGGYKSYHVLGSLTNFFGGYWHDDDFGFGHYANYAGKPGKKLWIWGLSRQGMIWEDLLTDTDGQYVEIQSGRLFNQEASESVNTPFKHRGFAPFATDVWTEYWFPVMKTEGVTQATPKAAINLEVIRGDLQIWVSANEPINDSLKLMVGGKDIGVFKLNLSPTQVMHNTIPFKGNIDQIEVKIGTDYIIAPGGTAGQKLSRPKTTVDFDWKSIQGLSMKAKALEQERNFTGALDYYQRCLSEDPNYIPALVGAAGILNRNMAYNQALELASRALAIDTYYPAANFIYGAVNARLGKIVDAIDGFSIASASVEYKSASYLELAKIYFKWGEYDKTIDFVEKSLLYNGNNFSAKELLLITYRKSNNQSAWKTSLAALLKSDPLNHLARFENYLMSKKPEDLNLFKSMIRNELPYETYLELAIKYYNLGLSLEAIKVLQVAPKQPVISYWYAYLSKDSAPRISNDKLLVANNADLAFVLPFRQETIKVLKWASEQSGSWKPIYYQALIWWNLSNTDKAKELFLKVTNEPDASIFYLAKAKLFKDDPQLVEQSLIKAHQLSPEWRSSLALTELYLSQNNAQKAIQIIKPAFDSDPKNYYLGLVFAKTLMLKGQNKESLSILQGLTVLPNEGATEGHHLHRIVSLNLAIEALTFNDYDLVENYLKVAKSWPENLGVGKPYVTDERLEDYFQGLALKKSGEKKKAKQLFKKIVEGYTAGESNLIVAEDFIVLAAYLQLDDNTSVTEIVSKWHGSYPNNDYVKWAVAWLNGNPKELKSTLENIEQTNTIQKIGSREFYLQWVISFLNANPIK